MQFDPALLLRDLATLTTTEWTAHFVPDNYEGDWSAIPLRSPEGARHPIQMIFSDPMAKAFVSTPYLDLCPYFREVIAAFQCDTQCIRLMRLTPGSVIKEHRDHDLAAEFGMARIHIPITTNPQVVFEVNRIPVEMAPGETWYLRLADPHRVVNGGDSDRVHLVIDAAVNDWMTDLLEQACTLQDV
jgi:quercetin dioxygenase-like cupin family protein